MPRSGRMRIKIPLVGADSAEHKAMSTNTFFLEPIPPFRLDLTVRALRRHPDNAIDRWNDQTYRRIIPVSGQAVELAVEQVSPPEAPRLRVTVRGISLDSKVKGAAMRVLKRLLGLQIDLRDFYRLASPDSRLGPLVQEFQGMKPPQSPTVFESVVSAIACQQKKLAEGIRLLNHLSESRGLAIADDGRAHAFPRPEDLVGLDSGTLHSMGFSKHKANCILWLARSIFDEYLDLENITTLTDEAAHALLVALSAVGHWGAQFVLLRGLGRLHVFPADDVDARNSLQQWMHRQKPVGHSDVGHIRDPWKPYAGLIYFYLLLKASASTSSS
jgi:DNA-3-methyladenine glycosylase II